MKFIEINGRKIGSEFAPYIIAEVSANHNGDLNKALKLIEIAKDSGADAVKIQTYTADTMTVDSDMEDFQIKGGLWDGYTLYKLYEEAHTPWDWHKPIFERAKELGITVFSTPFDESSVNFLMDLDVPAFKIASFEMTDLPLVEYIAKQGKPIIMSTGMASPEEIEESINVIKKYNQQIIVLHCVSGYPTPIDQSNLSTIKEISKRFDVVSGLSDHTLGTAASVAGVALGASVIEKHFTESRSEKGPDSEFSLEPSELESLVNETRSVWNSVRSTPFKRESAEKVNLKFRRSIYFVRDLEEGEEITLDSVKRIRPGYGLEPKYFNEIIGKKVLRKVSKNTPVKLLDIDMGK
ncbi:putative N-acetylneuraminic acid synthetase [Halobacteriovorax marinus SJ]|uniref:N-acetylneuraminic acid synthetase n=1 Tax=Halobacteriovorax marinus (strain ATCC BAA-682 / DSM 15412 / SJ) TaxID=862908 RepID=E1X3T9_HALMS|nr:pseudaminic acid synthase [Halobacteriovorax marinus]CBW25279.1 putative N-acetylneuraminic acid synthetase [Halobacteriovorax marinus SJ]